MDNVLKVVHDETAVIEELKKRIQILSQNAIEERGCFMIGLSGMYI